MLKIYIYARFLFWQFVGILPVLGSSAGAPIPRLGRPRAALCFLVYIPTYIGDVFVHIAQKFLRIGK